VGSGISIFSSVLTSKRLNEPYLNVARSLNAKEGSPWIDEVLSKH